MNFGLWKSIRLAMKPGVRLRIFSIDFVPLLTSTSCNTGQLLGVSTMISRYRQLLHPLTPNSLFYLNQIMLVLQLADPLRGYLIIATFFSPAGDVQLIDFHKVILLLFFNQWHHRMIPSHISGTPPHLPTNLNRNHGHKFIHHRR